MKLLGACLVAFSLLVSTAAAQSLRRVPADGKTIGELMQTLRQTSAQSSRRKVIGLDSSDVAFVFAAAGSVQGAGGTYFRSDVNLVNHRSVAQEIAIGWMAQGVDNSSAPLQYFEIPANTPLILSDFVAQTLGESGLGAVLVTGVTSSGDPDINAALDGFSRIWTPQPGASGSVSQGFPSVSFDDSFGTPTAYALGLRQDGGFRTNVGIVNLDSVAHTWTVGVNGLNGSTSFAVSVPPLSMKQAPLPSGNYGNLILSLDGDASGFWSAYGASVDNVSGDSWSSHASQP